MKRLTTIILLLCSCFFASSQKNLEIIGTVVNSQNKPLSSVTVSIPAVFLRTNTTQEGRFHLSLENVDFKMDDFIEISSTVTDEIVKMTIGDYVKLNNKNIVLNDRSLTNTKNKKTIATNTKEPYRYTNAKKTSLLLNNVKKGNEISIKNDRGKMFFKEIIETSNLKKKEFDLNFLQDGSYFFEIEKDLKINVIPFAVSYEKGITYFKNRETILYKPIIKLKDEVIILNQLSPNREPITIDIYNDNSNDLELLYTETVKDEQSIQRAYKLEKGSFKFIITANNNEYETLINTYDE